VAESTDGELSPGFVPQQPATRGIRREARGNADGILMRFLAEAEGTQKLLEAKAAGYSQLVSAAGGDAKSAATLLMIEKMQDLVQLQVEAISRLKIDKITVWDSGSGGNSSTANFLSSLIKSIPPLQDVAEMVGVELPDYLGKMKENPAPTPPPTEEKL
jgi:flotillin